MKVVRFVSGMLLGLALGWAVGSLFAPRSGQEMQQEVRRRIELVIDEGRRAAEERRAELDAELASAQKAPPAGA